MYSPEVTIIIPVYNGSNFMCEAIDSAIAQTYENTEIIVVNDGSTDNGETERLALSYGNRIRYFYKENGGVSSALNYALSKANGEYVSWLSHDDLYFPKKIEREVLFLNQILENEPELDKNRIVIHCATESIDKSGKVLKRPSYKGVDEKEDTIKVIIDNVYRYRLSGCSFLIPKAAFGDIGTFREDIRTVSDVEYWYRLLFNHYHFFCLTNEILVRNRSHGKQVGKNKVDLFDQELNDLYISIANQLYKSEEYGTTKNCEKFYYGLVFRKLKKAADYTRENLLKGHISKMKYKIWMPMKSKWYLLNGQGMDCLRIVYRKLLVK